MPNLRRFLSRARSFPTLPVEEDKIDIPRLGPQVIVGYKVRMAVGTRERTYWYSTIRQAVKAHHRFLATRRWPRKKNVRSVQILVDAPTPVA